MKKHTSPATKKPTAAPNIDTPTPEDPIRRMLADTLGASAYARTGEPPRFARAALEDLKALTWMLYGAATNDDADNGGPDVGHAIDFLRRFCAIAANLDDGAQDTAPTAGAL